ncbi:GntR family transcriptional regulator [Mesorhizobium sp. CAU 1741]|uniref:GntR family transcriptional regulator n=1 Tax=Mesorhizobium sp. CAU 1741 TaxID=3140366 RepID=UPI00325A60CB
MEKASDPTSARAYRALERMIVTLELPPGSVLTQADLIERLALGRTPVREAIQRLAWEGLVDVRPRSGLAIAPLHVSDWMLVIDARMGVETVLARSAARNIMPEGASRLRLAAMAMNKAVVAGNVLAFLEADKLVDEIIAAAAENIYAARVASPLQTHSRRFWYRYQIDSGLAQSAEHHVGLIGAILDGDEKHAAREAERLMAMLRKLAEQARARR